MNKAELVEEVAGKVGLTKNEAGNVIDAITSAITDSLERNEKVPGYADESAPKDPPTIPY